MSLYTKVCFVILGYFFSSIIVLNTCVCKKLEGYKFPVYSTEFCPRNESEWNKRSSALSCNKTNGYTCLPNENFTELLEFCYTQPFIWIQEGVCLYLKRKGSYVDAYSCSHFIDGCHNTSYQSRRIFDYPACITIGNGCFLAERSCKSSPNTTHQPETSGLDMDDWLWILIVIGIAAVVSFSSYMLYVYRKRKFSSCNGSTDKESTLNELEERKNLLTDAEKVQNDFSTEQLNIEEAMFNQWTQDDLYFISTRACKEVETSIRSRNLVIVAGQSGSGKSFIIQHIALKFRENGWTIKRVKEVEDILNEYSSSRFQQNKTICVFDDPLGKESFNEIFNNSWQKYEEELKLYLEKAKLMISCRNHIISDTRLSCYLANQSHIVDIDNTKNKLSVDEKRQILTKYTFDMNLSDKECDAIVKVERYFPLLCKLYSSNEDYKIKGIDFFTEPVTVLKEEILGFRKKDMVKYCALALLVLFNDDLCVSDLLKKKDTEIKFKHTLKLCGLQENTPPLAIGDALVSLKGGFFVKKIGDMYHFYHDFVMEVTTYVFGTDYPTEMIKFADIGFLRRRVRLGDCEKPNDQFTIYLSEKYVIELGERLFNELFGERFLNVVLNPCLRNEKIIQLLEKKIADHSENIKKLGETKKLTIDKQGLDQTSKKILLTKPSFLDLEHEVSPLFALIVFCHTQLSQYCLNNLQSMQTDFIKFFPAVCCNGSIELFCTVFKNQVKESLSVTWGGLYPIHIVSVFHNYELLNELVKKGVNVNQRWYFGLTPLLCAAGNDTEDCRNYYHEEPGETRRYKTVQLLLSKGAEINLCERKGVSPLYIACQNGYDSIVELLLSKGADINLCTEKGASPLFIACRHGHDSTVQLLLSKGADINQCKKNGVSPLSKACQNGHNSTVKILLSKGADTNLRKDGKPSPLYIACENGNDSIVQLLLSKEADINLCTENGASPLIIACQNGYNSIVQLLLSKGADINLCMEDGTSPVTVACFGGQDRTVQLLLCNRADINQCKKNGVSPLSIACLNGHDSTVQLLLNKGADINLCERKGASPLIIACQNGYDSIVQLLLSKGADINLCKEDGASPLIIACLKGHDSTVKLLLSKAADTNLRKDGKPSPLHVACENGHDSIVQLLLSKGADVNLCTENGASPLYVACQQGHDSSVQLLLSKGADINQCKKNGASPLFITCQNGHDSTVQLLLSKGADINLCERKGASPLIIACQNGYDSIVQLLLSKGADTNLCREDGASPLITACLNGHDSTVKLLLSKAADTNLRKDGKPSPLHVACENGHDSIVQLLLSKGADINYCTEDGASPLFIACHHGHDSTEQRLLSNGADTNLCRKDGTSPLFIACQNGHDSTVQLLLKNRADIILSREDGTSPLFIACENGHDSIVQLLLSKGAAINLCKKNGASPLFIACQNGHDSTVQLLLDHGADINLCNKDEVSPLYIAFACRQYKTANILLERNADPRLSSGLNLTYFDLADKNDSTTGFLQRKDNIYKNIYDPDSYFSLFEFCHVERMSRAVFFLHFYNS